MREGEEKERERDCDRKRERETVWQKFDEDRILNRERTQQVRETVVKVSLLQEKKRESFGEEEGDKLWMEGRRKRKRKESKEERKKEKESKWRRKEGENQYNLSFLERGKIPSFLWQPLWSSSAFLLLSFFFFFFLHHHSFLPPVLDSCCSSDDGDWKRERESEQ